MAHLLHIEFHATLEDSSVVARILNFKEDLHGGILKQGGAHILNPEAVDHALAEIAIEIHSKRHISNVTKLIQKLSANEHLADRIRVVRM